MKQFNLLLLITALIFAGCNSKSAKTGSSSTIESSDSVTTTPSVYIVAEVTWEIHYDDGGESFCKVVYWKDGVLTEITNYDSFAETRGIGVHNGDVYIVGEEGITSIGRACYWKNGVKTFLHGDDEWGEANGIAFSGEDIYIIGKKCRVAGYWKNGNYTPLSVGKTIDDALSIATLGNDIYIAGYESCYVPGDTVGPHALACYWKNGQKHYLKKDVLYSHAYRISISGKDIYISGDYTPKFADRSNGIPSIACYWKNGELVNRFDGNQRGWNNSIDASGSDLYATGSEHLNDNYIPRFWKNKDLMPIDVSNSPIKTQFDAVCVHGKDVYVAGTEKINDKTKVCYWKNGKKTIIQEIDNNVDIKGIVVQ